MHRTVIISDIPYECDTGCPTLRERPKLGVLANRVTGATLGLACTIRVRKGTNYTTRSFVIRAPRPIYSDNIKGNGMGRALDMYGEEGEIQRGF
jgi:hypothetical protein